MMQLSTGQDSTLKGYLELSKTLFGAESAAAKFLQKKIEDSPNGENEEVLADETQMLYALHSMNYPVKKV